MLPLLVVTLAHAEDIYVAQNASGTDNGTSCANAKSLLWLSDGDNWGVGAGKVSPGDTVRLCGSFTGQLSVLGSGTAGSPITIFFEEGANFTLSAGVATVAINVGVYNWITIDGNNLKGSIQWTDNGTGLAYSTTTIGVECNPTVGNIEIKGLGVTNGYIHLTSDTRTSDVGMAVHVESAGPTNISIHHCSFDMVCRGVYLVASSGGGAMRDVMLYSNLVRRVDHGFGGGTGGANCQIVNLCIYGNTIDPGADWQQANSWFHVNGIYFFSEASATGAYLSNTFIFNNRIGPNVAAFNTAGIFLSASIEGDARVVNTYVFNNVIFGDNYSNGKLFAWVCYNYHAFNNTLNDNSALVRVLIGGNISFMNNIGSRSKQPLYIPPAYRGSGFTSIFNNYSELGYAGAFGGYFGDADEANWPTWTGVSYLYDAGSNTNLAQFTSVGSDFHIPAGTNTAASGTGTNLTVWVTGIGGMPTNAMRDIEGRLRPATAPWSMGAYEPNYVQEVAAATAAVVLSGQQSWSGAVRFQ